MFVHLHNHSDYSLLDGACRISDLIKSALDAKAPAVGLTDHGNLYGALEFYKKAREASVKPLIGCELYMAPESRHTKKPGRAGELRFHQVLLAKNYTGYRNLCYLSSEAFTTGFYYKPRIDKELLAAHSEGLICLSSCMQGEIPQAILTNTKDLAVELISWYKNLFGDDFYIELMRHQLPDDETLVSNLAQMARDFGIKTVATNDAHYLKREHAGAHDVLLCVGTQTKRDDPNRLRFSTPEFYVKSEAEMRALFSDIPEALDVTLEIAEKCDVEIPLDIRHYPVFQIPKDSKAVNAPSLTEKAVTQAVNALPLTVSDSDGAAVNLRGLTAKDGESAVNDGALAASDDPAYDYLAQLATEGFHKRYGKQPTDEANARLARELEVIKMTGFSNYFLIVWDFVRWAKEHGVPVGPGRGSAAGCIVSYSLGITNLDPIKYGLIFERFLNPERVSPPDIDIDFADDRREEVISYVREKYGADSVCRIITFGTMAAKSAVKDVARALGMTYAEGDRITKLIPEVKDMNLKKAVTEVAEIRQLRESDPRYAELLDIALVLEGSVRQSGVHAAGVVICPGPVVEYVPVSKANSEDPDLYTQFDMTWMDAAGLLKMDFLGLQTLQELDLTLKALKRQGIEIDLDNIPLDDPAVFQLFADGHTTGVFQFESGGMRDNLMKLKPERLDDLIAMNALFRPGPMQMIDEFIACRHGRKKAEYLHPKLEPILKETYGVIVYQEQCIRIATDLAGYSLGRADLFRRAMGKKKPEIMKAERAQFVTGCEANGVSKKVAEEIYAVIEHFAGYGFVKAHSSGYALIAYQCAYLKVHHPADYLAACLTVRRRDANQVLKLLAECRALGIKLLLPDVNESDAAFKATDQGIRFGLAAIKNIGDSAVEAIIKGRNGATEGGARVAPDSNPARDGGSIGIPSYYHFTSLFQFIGAMDTRTVNHKAVESLIDGGAFDSLGANRATLLNSLNGALAYAQALQDERERGQESLFGGGGAPSDNVGAQGLAPLLPLPELQQVPEWPPAELLSREKAMLGYYISSHPLERYQREIEGLSSRRLADKDEFTDNMPIKVCGVITSVSKKLTKNGDRWAAVQIEDLTAPIECLVFPQAFVQCEPLLVPDKLIAVSGRISCDVAPDSNPALHTNPTSQSNAKIRVDEIIALEQAAEKWGQQVRLKLPSERITTPLLDRLERLFDDYPGNCGVVVEMENGKGKMERWSLNRKVRPAPEVLSRLSELAGGAERVVVGR